MAVPPARPVAPPTGAGPALPGRRALRVALVMVVPYVLLALAWVFANPVGGAPDEGSHLVKALGVARLDLGVPETPAPSDAPLIVQRNISITRLVTIPAKVNPHGYTCFAFQVDRLPTCQQTIPLRHGADGKEFTTLGAYPPYVYPPIGLAASLGHTPTQAFLLGRLVVLVETAVLLLLATWHLVRWLGRRALLGVMVYLTPLAVFCMAIVNTSGVEVFGALCVASVVTVYARRPESLLATSTHVVTLAGGTLLVLSRQLGVVAMGALLLLLLALGGWREVLLGLRRRRPGMIATVAVIGLAAVASAVWELRYDHPVHVGPLVDAASWRDWSKVWLPTAQSGVAWFGWLEVRMPAVVTTGWLVLIAATLVLGVLLARRHRDRVALVVFSVVVAGVAYAVYSSVFQPVQAGLQGRHVLPLLAVVPVLAGATVAQRLPRVLVGTLFTLLALVLPALQLWGFVLNAERYAVGLSHQTLDLVARAQWAPTYGGWYPWLALAALATVLMAVSWVWLGVTSGRDDAATVDRAPEPATDPVPATA